MKNYTKNKTMTREEMDKYNFGGNRKIAMTRDGWKCVKCGMTNEQHLKTYGRELAVDHINGKGTRVPSSERDNRLENLQTLCSVCHGKKENETDREKDKRVYELRKEGLTFREIAMVVGDGEDMVHHRYKREAMYSGKLPPVKILTREERPYRVLTESDVIEIRGKYVPKKYTQVMLAKEYNTSKYNIYKILSRDSWENI
jgi:hypothetical protein